jgi:hypothetical protein
MVTSADCRIETWRLTIALLFAYSDDAARLWAVRHLLLILGKKDLTLRRLLQGLGNIRSVLQTP